MIYKPAPGTFLPKLDYQAVGERLTELQDGEGFTPAMVVEDAKPETSPMHPAFTWDVQKAAQKCWEEEAGYLIRHIVAVDDDGKEGPSFVSVQRDGRPQAYESTQSAMEDATIRKQVLDGALAELKAWQRRYHRLKELADIFTAIDGFGH